MHLQIDYKTHLRLKNIKAPSATAATLNPAAANNKMLLSFLPSVVASLIRGASVVGVAISLLFSYTASGFVESVSFTGVG